MLAAQIFTQNPYPKILPLRKHNSKQDMKKLLAVLFLFTLSYCAFGQDVNKLIDQDDVERIIKTLSADDMQGRATFTPGIEKAARFIEGEYKQIGLKPFPGDDGFRQNFSMTRSTPVKTFVNINGKLISPDSVFTNTSAAALGLNKISSGAASMANANE